MSGTLSLASNDISNHKLAMHLQDMTVVSPISRILLIYTGGTIGMKHTSNGYLPAAGYLSQTLTSMTHFHDPLFMDHPHNSLPLFNPVNIPIECSTTLETSTDIHQEIITINGTKCLKSNRPALISPCSLYGKRIRYSILEYDPLLDSSNMTMKDWIKIATDIEVNYKLFDAFIILHGTDTMAYTASALSFMLENLGKTVIITGSQVPLAEVRNDAVDNLLGALTIAGHFVIPEVGLYFDHRLFRGNRSSKVNAIEFNAFDTPNLHPLVKVGVNINVAWSDVWRQTEIAKFKAHKSMNPYVATLRLFPGITETTVRAFLSHPIAGIVLETFGSGNAPNNRPELLQCLKEASDRGVVIVNCTQCKKGLVTDLYATGRSLLDVGVVPGSDMTPECALTKLSYLLSKYDSPSIIREYIRKNMRGELTIPVRKQRFTYLQSHSLVATILSLLGKDHVDENLENDISALEKTMVPMVMCQAARTGDVNAIKTMAESYGHLVNTIDYDGRTPLHIAASEGQLHAVKCLLKLGSSIHARDRFGHTPLRNAIKFGYKSIFKVLISSGAHITELEGGEVTNELMTLVGMGDLARIRMLTEAGANLNLPWIDSRTPLHMASRENQIDVVKYFVQVAIKINQYANQSTKLDENPISQVELEDDVNFNYQPINLSPMDKYGKTPIDDAIHNGTAGKVVVEILREGIETIILGGYKLVI